jgi:molecular chaperone IbpA
MRTYDLSPLYRATVGFDRMADLLDRVLTQDTAPSTYPPYNIEKTAMTPTASRSPWPASPMPS